MWDFVQMDMAQRRRLAAVIAAGLLYLEAEEDEEEEEEDEETCDVGMSALHGTGLHPRQQYAILQRDVPILATYYSEADLKPAFRLSRGSCNRLLQMLPREKTHGWSHEVEVLVTVYWLACGASYRVTADTFAMPFSTVCRVAHSVVEQMITIIHKVIHFPRAEDMEEVGAGFALLAGH